MSNPAVGNVYQSIIDEVINSSRVDFEEGGVEESALDELRLGWQKKLSQLDVATFPWDPKPEPLPPVQHQPPPQPSSSASQAQQHFIHNASLPDPGMLPGEDRNGMNSGPNLSQDSMVKEESNNQPLTPFGASDNKDSIAATRAAQQLQAQYGVRATGSINAIRDGISQPAMPQTQTPPVPQALPQYNGSAPTIKTNPENGQTDGAADMSDDDDSTPGYEGVLLRQTADGASQEIGRLEIDKMLHDHIATNAKASEGGGLMLPLKPAGNGNNSKPSRSRSQREGIAGYDGLDDAEVDEDAINSDLDDSDDGGDDDEVDDDGLGHIMLCMYDKVQRVKNKWKCTLKDGVLTVNGKEYVFHKATGEYEW